jgi:D-amino-acid oxidase
MVRPALHHAAPSITVIGAGISGLATAWLLRERGYLVRIVARETGTDTTSAIAGARWFPYLVEPPELVNRWARETYLWLEEIARTSPEAGVDMQRNFEGVPDRAEPWWLAGIPEHVPVQLVERCPIHPAAHAWTFIGPRVDPSVFLPWMMQRLASAGVVTERGSIASFDQVEGDIIINCTGLGARTLCRDTQLEARMGQLLHVLPGHWNPAVTASAKDKGETTYVIPRRAFMVLGGCALTLDRDTPPPIDPSINTAILARAQEAGIRHGAIVGQTIGLRPWRKSVRLERDPQAPHVIHNYGHGGAGWTLCWGCAQNVAEIIDTPTPSGA